MPHDLPPHDTLYGDFSPWMRDGAGGRLNTELGGQARPAVGKDPEPSAGAIDSHSAKTSEGSGRRGYDKGQPINGRKRRVRVGPLGLVLFVVVHTTDSQDRDRARLVFDKTCARFPRLTLIWADGGYARNLEFIDPPRLCAQ